MQRTGCIKELREKVAAARAQGRKIALVPTMGYLHKGHLTLAREAGKDGSFVVMSIFVNPIQFGPGEDFASYPRDLEQDACLANEAGVDLLFHPTAEEMYPAQTKTTVEVTDLTAVLCGASRPVHFKGVTTVVSKLFNIVQPDRAFFGQKDYQQYIVIKRMVRDLNFPIEIVPVPIVREEDGLALSSRNVNLSAEQRAEATVLSRSIEEAAQLIASGERLARKVEQMIKDKIRRESSGLIDYVEVRQADDLSEVAEITEPVVIALAVRFGSTRLIDNKVIGI